MYENNQSSRCSAVRMLALEAVVQAFNKIMDQKNIEQLNWSHIVKNFEEKEKFFRISSTRLAREEMMN